MSTLASARTKFSTGTAIGRSRQPARNMALRIGDLRPHQALVFSAKRSTTACRRPSAPAAECLCGSTTTLRRFASRPRPPSVASRRSDAMRSPNGKGSSFRCQGRQSPVAGTFLRRTVEEAVQRRDERRAARRDPTGKSSSLERYAPGSHQGLGSPPTSPAVTVSFVKDVAHAAFTARATSSLPVDTALDSKSRNEGRRSSRRRGAA